MPPGEFSSAFPDGGSAENASRVKKRLIVHIGVHKTGSTSIQHTLFRNTGQMADRGFLYPRFYAGRVNAVNHTSLAWEIEMNKLDHARLRNWAASLNILFSVWLCNSGVKSPGSTWPAQPPSVLAITP